MIRASLLLAFEIVVATIVVGPVWRWCYKTLRHYTRSQQRPQPAAEWLVGLLALGIITMCRSLSRFGVTPAGFRHLALAHGIALTALVAIVAGNLVGPPLLACLVPVNHHLPL